MKVILYQLSFAKEQKRFNDEIEFCKEMKKLWQMKIKFTPMVLVENVPGKTKATWLMLNEYRKILKKEGQANGSEESC